MNSDLIPAQQEFLLSLARNAIQSYIEKGERIEVGEIDPALKEKRGAFVTLKIDDNLRGCIGYPLPFKTLAESVIDLAIAAATEDFRFTPISREEISEMTIEISVLSLPEKIKNPSEVEVGRHGIIISKGKNRGLLLPQVPVEWNWDREAYLKHGCLKAGLPEDSWRKGADIEVFTAQVFLEKLPAKKGGI